MVCSHAENDPELSPDEEGERERIAAWMAAFRIEPPRREEDAKAPPLTAEAMQAMLDFLGGRAAPEVAAKVVDLCLRFRSWARKLTDLSLAELRRSEGELRDRPQKGEPDAAP